MPKHSNAAAFAALLTLAACSQAPVPSAPTDGTPADAVRVALPSAGAEPQPHPSGNKPAWSGNGREVSLAYSGEAPLMRVACDDGRLVITRLAFAEPGAQALFALMGNGAVLRLPVDATTVPGQNGPVWRGSVAANAEKSKVFLGERFEGTLPGAGKLDIPGAAPLRDLVTACAGEAPPLPSPVP